MRVIPATLPLLFALLFTVKSASPRKRVALPFKWFLLQQPAFEVEEEVQDSNGSSEGQPPLRSVPVPLVMRVLFQEAEQVSRNEVLPEGGDFYSLARSFLPTDIKEVGLHRVVLNFPAVESKALGTGDEAWLVFQLHQSRILGYNCSQVVTVYENDQSKMKAVVTVPLSYQNNRPLLVINVTESVRRWKGRPPSYAVIIKDSTSYTADLQLLSFSNYVDCSLATACEVLELHSPRASPVLLVLSEELAAMNVLESPARFRREIGVYETATIEPATTMQSAARKKALEEATGSAQQDQVQYQSQEARNSCRLVQWHVNIEQLGWDWLVYPERIPLNLCLGTCPVLLDRHFNATSHAVARGLYRLVLGSEAKPENRIACCVPVKYRRFTMLIEKTPGIISLETSSDLSAAQCGCR